MASGTKTGLSICGAWDALFCENEKRAHKKGLKPWTDAQMTKMMAEDHVRSKGKSGTNRPRMYRSHFNSATYGFEGRPRPSDKTPNRRVSHEYDSEGKEVVVKRGPKGPTGPRKGKKTTTKKTAVSAKRGKKIPRKKTTTKTGAKLKLKTSSKGKRSKKATKKSAAKPAVKAAPAGKPHAGVKVDIFTSAEAAAFIEKHNHEVSEEKIFGTKKDAITFVADPEFGLGFIEALDNGKFAAMSISKAA